MSIFDYSSCIKIDFDKAILSDVSTIKPDIEKRIEDFTLYVSGTNSSYPASNAIDGSTSTYWRSSSTAAGQWIGFYTVSKIELTKIRVYFGYSSGIPNAYRLIGSDDNANWTEVNSGNFDNASVWQEVPSSGHKFKYWRLVFDSRYSSRYTCSEFQAYGFLATSGWEIIGDEYTTEPQGYPISVDYLLDKVTKSEDNLSLFLWLELGKRMRNPRSVTVSFSGNLSGAGGAQVEPFIETFTPVNITPIFNPNAPEYLTMKVPSITVQVKEVVYSSAQSGDEYLTAKATGVTIVVTKVGSLPL